MRNVGVKRRAKAARPICGPLAALGCKGERRTTPGMTSKRPGREGA